MNDIKLNIEYVDIDSIKPYEKNAKIHTPEQIEQIKDSILKFGMNDPIGVWHGQIAEGHGRFFACKELRYKVVPIIRLDDLTDEERRAYMLVHNKLTMNTDFDLDVLGGELDDIVNIDMSQFGFDDLPSNNDGDNNEPLKDISYTENMSVVVECENEDEAERIFNELTEEGYKCRISTL